MHQVRIGYDLRLVVSDPKWSDENEAQIVIEEPCVVTYPDGSEHGVQIAARETIPPLLTAQARRISEVSAEAGALRVVLDDGGKIVIPSSDEYEAWRIEGPGETSVVCLPGGELLA